MSESIRTEAKKPEANKHVNSVSKARKVDVFRSVNSPVDQILFLQRTIGNQAVMRMLNKSAESKAHGAQSRVQGAKRFAYNSMRLAPCAIQAKLKIGQPNDIYEQEADRVAEQVMRMPEPGIAKGSSCGEEAAIGKKIMPKRVQLSGDDAGQIPDVTPSTESAVSSLTVRGQPLSQSERSFFEPRFGADFSGVRVHSGAQAGEMAQSLQAKAFTVGRDIYFGTGQYSPDTSEGRRLLSHELTHVVQQLGAVGGATTVQRQITSDPCSLDKIWGTWDAMKEMLCASFCNPFDGKECRDACGEKYGPWAKLRECRKRHPLPPPPDIWEETP